MDLEEDRGWQLIAVVTAFLALSWIAVATRCYVRLVLIKAFQIDDWLMLIALGIWSLTGAFIIVGVHYGLGRHNNAPGLSRENEVRALEYQALATALYIANMAFIKLSIAFLLLRITIQRRYIWILRVAMIVVACWSIAIFIFDIFQCSPVAYQWDNRIEGGKCVSASSIVNAAYSFSVMAVLSDWLFALLPIPMLWNVKLNPQTKFIVAGILSLGIFASIATLIRIKYLIEITDNVDVLFSSTDALIWTIVETGLGITAASIVTLRPLLRALKITGFNSSGVSNTPAANGVGGTDRFSSVHGLSNGNGYMRSVEMPELKPRITGQDFTIVSATEVQTDSELERGSHRDISENDSAESILIMGTDGAVWHERSHEVL